MALSVSRVLDIVVCISAAVHQKAAATLACICHQRVVQKGLKHTNLHKMSVQNGDKTAKCRKLRALAVTRYLACRMMVRTNIKHRFKSRAHGPITQPAEAASIATSRRCPPQPKSGCGTGTARFRRISAIPAMDMRRPAEKGATIFTPALVPDACRKADALAWPLAFSAAALG